MSQYFPEFRTSDVTSPVLGNSFDGVIYTEYDNFLRQVGFFSVPSGVVRRPVPVHMPAKRVVAGTHHNPIQMPGGQPHNHRNVGALGPTQLVTYYAAGTSRASDGMGHVGRRVGPLIIIGVYFFLWSKLLGYTTYYAIQSTTKIIFFETLGSDDTDSSLPEV
jgi:hypothetical protein